MNPSPTAFDGPVQVFSWMTKDEVFAERHIVADPMSHIWDLVADTRSDRRTFTPLRSCHICKDGKWLTVESIDGLPNR